jgi:two-component system NtrC family response regulator
MAKILVVEDNIDLRENMKWALKGEYEVFEAGSSQECIDIFSRTRPDVVCLDMGLDNVPEKGLELINTILLKDRSAKIIVITANSRQSLGADAVHRGAFDYFTKPVDIANLKLVIGRALRIHGFEKEQSELKDDILVNNNSTFQLIGNSTSMKTIFELIQKLANTDVSVLITGESGTGKELCARAIHYNSKRCVHNFVPINCGAIPENLIESELFGYVKGAFTGANTDKEGLIESADGGTLLLDEIGEMPKNLQVKLLRFLQDQRIQRVGGTMFKTVDVRIIAATNRKDLDGIDSSLRNDLYYRLSEFQIDLPPLRDRERDVLLIASAIIERNRVKFGAAKLQLSTRAENALMGYSWPGNVRELENKLSRAAITCTNQIIEPDDLKLPTGNHYSELTYKDAKQAFEKEYFQALLEKYDFNISETAGAAGISRPTLYDMMKKLNIQLEKEIKVKGEG